MMKKKRTKTKVSERLKKIVWEIAEIYNNMQEKFAEKAQEAGYARDIFRNLGSVLDENLPDDPLLEINEQSLKKFRDFLNIKQERIYEATKDIGSSAYAVSTSTSASVDLVIPKSPVFRPPTPPFWEPDRKDAYGRRFDRLSPSLGKTYRSIHETFYGTRDDPERAAMFQARQAFDEFFQLLAPDEDVRNSKFFKRKKGLKPDQVSRSERIQYAAHFCVQDEILAESLAVQADHVVEIYKRLNKAHKRGILERENVLEDLKSMLGVLEQWVDALKD
jgi:hypothetical protein